MVSCEICEWKSAEACKECDLKKNCYECNDAKIDIDNIVCHAEVPPQIVDDPHKECSKFSSKLG